jgi:hypothetical protein
MEIVHARNQVAAGLQPAWRALGRVQRPNGSDHRGYGVEIRAVAALNAPQGSPRTQKRCGYL